jgi:hypothetical protein
MDKFIEYVKERTTRLLETLPTYTRSVVERVMVEGVTRELIAIADNAPDVEWECYQILRMITGAVVCEKPDDCTPIALEEIIKGIVSGTMKE